MYVVQQGPAAVGGVAYWMQYCNGTSTMCVHACMLLLLLLLQGVPPDAAQLPVGVWVQRASHTPRCWCAVPAHAPADAALGGGSGNGSQQRVSGGELAAAAAVQAASGLGGLVTAAVLSKVSTCRCSGRHWHAAEVKDWGRLLPWKLLQTFLL